MADLYLVRYLSKHVSSVHTVSGERESDVLTQRPNYGSKHLEEVDDVQNLTP